MTYVTYVTSSQTKGSSSMPLGGRVANSTSVPAHSLHASNQPPGVRTEQIPDLHGPRPDGLARTKSLSRRAHVARLGTCATDRAGADHIVEGCDRAAELLAIAKKS